MRKIELNIIKGRYEKYAKKRLYIRLIGLYILGLVFVLFTIGVNFLFTRIQIQKITGEIKNIKEKMMKEKNVIEKIKRQNAESKKLLQKIMDYQAEKKNRIDWAPKLAEIGNSVPYGVWIDKLTGEIKYSKKNKKEKIINIEGYVLPQLVNEKNALAEFIKNLEKYHSFKKTFLSEVRREKKNDIEVVYFKIKTVINEKNGNGNA